MAKKPDGQLELPYIPRNLHGEVVTQRRKDGYINATAMCKAAGREFKHYHANASTKAFISALSPAVGIPTAELIQILSGGNPSLQGTWVHPQVAIHLAQWLSPEFAVQVSGWVFEWVSTGQFTKKGSLPYHLRRYVANQPNIPRGHFSILNEIIIGLVAPLEIYGYTLPESLWPDISEGKMFAKWLREEKNIDTNTLPTYMHVFEDPNRSFPVRAKAYPNILLADFRAHFNDVWLPQRSRAYFSERDARALEYLPRLLAAPEQKDE